MFTLPEDYIVLKFFNFVGKPSKNRYNNTYQGSCPMCREGNSWLRKRRFYYIPNKNLVFCHNCGYSSNPLKWIMDVTGNTFDDIKHELDDSFVQTFVEKEEKEFVVDTLPKDCINLFDEAQIQFYKSNKMVSKTVEFLKNRMLLNAINRPKALYLSLTDKFHKNRLILPFFGDNGKILHYQSRSILDEDVRPRYISKINSDKTVFNFDKIDMNMDTVFIFEGPINSCFVKNGVAIGGIQENSYQLFTARQQEQMDKIPFHKRIWVLDSQYKDRAAFNKTKKLIELKETVFLWPENLGKSYKDFNDITMELKSDYISTDFVLKYSR